MAKTNHKQRDPLELLRDEAEKILSSKKSSGKGRVENTKVINELLHEIEIFQVELEMQNDELKFSQELLEKERFKFLQLFDLAPVGYFIVDRVGLILECNETGIALLNEKRSRLIGTRFSNYFTLGDAPPFYAFLKRIKDNNAKQTCQLKMHTQDKKLFYGLLEGSLIYDHVEASSNYYIAVIDITEKRNAELKQLEFGERLEMALKASSTGTWDFRVDSQSIKLDSYASEMFQLGMQPYSGPFSELLENIHKEDRGIMNKRLMEAIRFNRELSVEFRTVSKNGDLRYFEAKGHNTAHYKDDRYFTGIITDITIKKKLEKEADALVVEQQKKVLKAIIETQENERVRISNSIHDGIGQLLYASNLNLEKVPFSNDHIDKAKKLIDQAVYESRNISFELSPSILSDYGLLVALKEMTRRISISELNFTLRSSGFGVRMQVLTEVFLFRIIQELANNIIKHAKATEATIWLKKKKDSVVVKVSDNGSGFNVKKSTTGSGLLSIKNRLMLYGGTMKIKSSRTTGTCVSLRIENMI